MEELPNLSTSSQIAYPYVQTYILLLFKNNVKSRITIFKKKIK